VADDLRDCIGRHRDPPEIGRSYEKNALVHDARLDDGLRRRVAFEEVNAPGLAPVANC